MRRAPRRVARQLAVELDRAPERVGAEGGDLAALGHVLAQAPQQVAGQPQLAAGEGHARRVPEQRRLAAGERDVGREVVAEPLALEPAQQRGHLGVEARREAAARKRAIEAHGARVHERVREPVAVVVLRVEPLPGQRRQHEQRQPTGAHAADRIGPALSGRLRLRPPDHRKRPDRSLAAGAHAHEVKPGERVLRHPHPEAPAHAAAAAERLRRPVARQHEVEGAVEGADLEVHDRARLHHRQRAAQREAAHRHARARRRRARARDLGRRHGRVARPVAHGHREGVVAVGRRGGGVGAGADLAVPDSLAGLRPGPRAGCRGSGGPRRAAARRPS